jgi:membrane-bound lytic murein transglycosylase D
VRASWVFRRALGAFAAAALASCSVLRPVEDAPAAPEIRAPVPVAVAPSATPPSPEADAELADVVNPTLDPASPDPLPGDLLERVRNGLNLGQHYHSRIDSEAEWFARNPEYIERVFTRAAPYLHYIVGEVEARGLPLELALLPIIESAFQPYAYSSARATGLWQFMAATGGRFGLKQDWWYDGRRDVVAATQAALDYLEYLHGLFDGNWLNAIAAYNCGEGNVGKAIRRNRAAGRSIDFWNLKLPAETRGYVPRLLAMTRIVAGPEQYGLSIEGIADMPYFVRVATGGQISIAVAAELAGLTTEEMYSLNPAYHRWATDPTGPHFLLVPVETAAGFEAGVLQLTPDQRLRVERYAVREGDSVSSVAERFSTTAQHLRELNELGASNSLAVGAEIRVPSAAISLPPQVLQAAARVDRRGGTRGAREVRTVRAVHVVRRGESLWSIAKRHNMDVVQLANINRVDPADTLRAGQRLALSATAPRANSGGSNGGGAATSGDGRRVTYVVRRGDTLSGIARTLRVSIENLRDWNNLPGSAIKPGQRLVAFVRRRG